MANPEEVKIYQVEIPFEMDTDAVVRRLRFRNLNPRLEGMARELAEAARAVARPRAIYRVARPRVIDSATVEIDGVRFTSRALSKNLVDQAPVYPFVATAGQEMEGLPIPAGDVMRQYCLDIIKTVVLVSAVDHLSDYIKNTYSLGNVTHLNPGEIEDWPITQQKPLFALFGGAERQIGVTLTESGVMKPIKSRSGILFPNESGFVSCQLCTQVKCPGRRAGYDPALVEEMLGAPS